MSKKKIQHRLESLFTSLGQESQILPAVSNPILPGWTWECDARGLYVACGPQVLDFLGLLPSQFLGQPLASFRLVERSAQEFQHWLSQGQSSFEIELEFLAADDSPVAVRMKTSPLDAASGNGHGLHGCAEVLSRKTARPGDASRAARRMPDLPKESVAPEPEDSGLQKTLLPVTRPLPGLAEMPAKKLDPVIKGPPPFSPAVLSVAAAMPDTHSNLLLEIVDETGLRTWSEDEKLLVKQIADQLTLALENANLFEQTQAAMSALEVRERYQENVARAVSMLTERGTRALADVVQLLGETAQASRAYFFTAYEQGHETYWRPIAQWTASRCEPLPAGPSVQNISSRLWPVWSDRLRQAGVIAGRVSDLPENERRFFRMLGAQSVLHLAVPGPLAIPGVLGIDVTDYDRIWQSDEIAALQTTASALASTLAREQLLTQVQANLADTEALYEASAQLNLASSYSDILKVLMQHTVLGHSHVAAVSIGLFDHPWQEENLPEWLNPIAAWTHTASLQETPYPIGEWPAARMFLRPDMPMLLGSAELNQRLDMTTHLVLVKRWGAQSLVTAPLNVGGKWIGHMIASYKKAVEFSEQDARRLFTLAGQAAAAIQTIRLLEETRQRAKQLQTAAEIARDTSSTLALDTLLQRTVNLVCERFGYYHAAVFLIDESLAGAVVQEATGDAGAEMKRREHTLTVGSQSVVGQVGANGEPLLVNDVSQSPLHTPNPLLPFTSAELGLPLKIGQRVIGVLDVQAKDANAFSPDNISVLQVLADQVAVAVDNARSYELAQQAVEEMREVDRLKSQFLANMSHELRTPLNSIIGFSRVILKGIDGPVSEQQKQDLNAIYNSGQHLLGLINDVLDLSKIEAGKMELSFDEYLNLGDLINSVMSTVVGLVKDKPIKLQKEIAPDLPLIRADPLKIRQVLINLFSNAAKFTDGGAITVKAAVQTGPDAQPEVAVSVTDTGTGIPPEHLPKLFQPFSQVDGSLTRKSGGTGLGLSICRHLIEMHGGRISVESQVDLGSTFTFTLPLVAAEPTTGLRKVAPADRKTILVVEDELQVIHLYERYLSNHGYRVVSVKNPTQAFELARDLQPYAITLDVMMPGRDGWHVLQDLKGSPATEHIPVIICSILESQEKGFRLGAAGYLMKPILEEDLIGALNRLKRETPTR